VRNFIRSSGQVQVVNGINIFFSIKLTRLVGLTVFRKHKRLDPQKKPGRYPCWYGCSGWLRTEPRISAVTDGQTDKQTRRALKASGQPPQTQSLDGLIIMQQPAASLHWCMPATSLLCKRRIEYSLWCWFTLNTQKLWHSSARSTYLIGFECIVKRSPRVICVVISY